MLSGLLVEGPQEFLEVLLQVEDFSDNQLNSFFVVHFVQELLVFEVYFAVYMDLFLYLVVVENVSSMTIG